MSNSRKSRVLSDGERVLWQKAMAAVEPQGGKRADSPSNPTRSAAETEWLEAVRPRSVSKETVARPKPAANRAPKPDVSDRHALPPLEVGKTSGMDRRTADRLRRGRMDIDMRLDLHGLTQEQAHRRLLGFLTAAQAAGARCVLVITGKGRRNGSAFGSEVGRLKAAVPDWLNQPAFRPLVVSVTEARPKDGGSGALYVLIRRLREDRP